MNIADNTKVSKELYTQIGEESCKIILPYIDKIFDTVGCKTDSIAAFDNSFGNDELTLQFTTTKDVKGLFKIELVIVISFSNLDVEEYREVDNRILNMKMFVMPSFDIEALRFIYAVSEKFGIVDTVDKEVETHYTDVSLTETYDSQMQKIVNDYDNYFERDIEAYRKAVEFLISEGDPEFLSTFPDIHELFFF
jgi:hypothetical protein